MLKFGARDQYKITKQKIYILKNKMAAHWAAILLFTKKINMV